MGSEKTYIDENGYLRFTDSDKAVHRWVAEKYVVRRKLRRGEVVHHKDGNPRNNNPDNLQVMHKSEHNQLHEEMSPGWHAKHGIREQTVGCGGILTSVIAGASLIFVLIYVLHRLR